MKVKGAKRLKRVLGLFELTMYGVGIILGAGIYVLIGEAAGEAGNAVWISFLLSGALATLTGLSFAELSSMFPKDAGPYIYTKRAFNSGLFSFMVGWMLIIAIAMASAVVILGFSGYLKAITGLDMFMTSVAALIVIALLNIRGIKDVIKLNIIFTALEILGLLIIIYLGLPHLGSVNYFDVPSVAGIISATVIIFFAYLGFEDIVSISEEVKDPKRTVPTALILSIAIASVIYILVALSAVSLVSWQELAAAPAPLAKAAEAAFPNANMIISIIAVFATFSTAFLLQVAGSRLAYGIACQGALPKFCRLIHSKTGTPWLAAVIIALLSLSLIFIGEIKTIAKVTNFVAFFVFTAVNLSVIALRYREPHTGRSFKVPLSIKNVPVLPLIGSLFSFSLLLSTGLAEITMGIEIMIVGLFIHVAMERNSKFRRERYVEHEIPRFSLARLKEQYEK